jgi:hypothetical protein
MVPMGSEIYVPLSDETLQKLDELVSLTGLTEDGLIGMLLYKFLRELRTYENDNFPDTEHRDAALPPEALSLSSRVAEGEPAGL